MVFKWGTNTKNLTIIKVLDKEISSKEYGAVVGIVEAKTRLIPLHSGFLVPAMYFSNKLQGQFGKVSMRQIVLSVLVSILGIACAFTTGSKLLHVMS